jgi:hypothetical protein
MTGGEGFAKVMPAAFGFPWYLFFWIDKVLPIFISILKLARDQITMATNHLVGFGNYIITFRRIGCWSSFGGRSWLEKLLLLGCCNIGYRIGIQIGRNCRVNAFAKNGNEQMEKFHVWAIFH